MAEEEVREPVEGAGYAAANVDAIGDDYGFRKLRQELGVTAFGLNAIAMPAGYESGIHFHEEQEETYIVLRGTARFTFGDESSVVLGPGGVVRVDPPTHRKVKNVGDDDLIYVCAGGKDGYVGRDGHLPPGEERAPGGPPGAASG